MYNVLSVISSKADPRTQVRLKALDRRTRADPAMPRSPLKVGYAHGTAAGGWQKKFNTLPKRLEYIIGVGDVLRRVDPSDVEVAKIVTLAFNLKDDFGTAKARSQHGAMTNAKVQARLVAAWNEMLQLEARMQRVARRLGYVDIRNQALQGRVSVRHRQERAYRKEDTAAVFGRSPAQRQRQRIARIARRAARRL